MGGAGRQRKREKEILGIENSSRALGSHFLKGSSPHFWKFVQQHHQPAGYQEKALLF